MKYPIFLTGLILMALSVVAACGGGNTESAVNDVNPEERATQVAEQASAMGGLTAETAPASGGQCTADADCVPDACCHAKNCVPQADAPQNCAEIVCTMECAPGTMDCGAGACACLNGTCGVKWRDDAAGGSQQAE